MLLWLLLLGFERNAAIVLHAKDDGAYLSLRRFTGKK